MKVAAQKVVTITYTLKDEKGEVLDTSEGREPMAYLHGAANIVPGLEAALEGKEAGESLEVTLPPEQGYGVRDEQAIRNVATRKLSPDRKVAVGERYRVSTPEGGRIVTVLSVKGDYATIDANHPLAGITLHFAVSVVDVRDASAEEVAHGHVHTPGAHHH
ncbi:MAG: peptidylprolyl isomerase [Myxococcales bacterium]|nr:peptidylprolyl isomerase [Myxococcales bacterium]